MARAITPCRATRGPVQGGGCLAAGRVIERTHVHAHVHSRTHTHSRDVRSSEPLLLFLICRCFCPWLSLFFLQTRARVSSSPTLLEEEQEARFQPSSKPRQSTATVRMRFVLKNCCHVILKAVGTSNIGSEEHGCDYFLAVMSEPEECVYGGVGGGGGQWRQDRFWDEFRSAATIPAQLFELRRRSSLLPSGCSETKS